MVSDYIVVKNCPRRVSAHQKKQNPDMSLLGSRKWDTFISN